MGFQKVEFEFPDTDNDDIEVEGSSAETIDLDAPAKEKVEAKAEVEVDDSDLEIEVVDDTPKKDRGRKPSEPPEDVTDEELENYSEKVRNRIKHFSKGYHDERRAKEQAMRERQELERYAQQLMEENKRLQGDNTKSREVLLEQARKNATAELESAKRAYKQAYESGDGDALLDAQDKLTNAKLKADKLENFKLPSGQAPNSKLETKVSQEEVTQTPQPIQQDKRAMSWAEKNTWFGTDDEMTAYALGLHNKLVKSGIDPTSDEYYETIDSRMRTVFRDNFDDADEPEVQPARKAANVVAPATRSRAPKKVKLTQSQVAIAKRLGVPLDIYAKQVADEMRKA